MKRLLIFIAVMTTAISGFGQSLQAGFNYVQFYSPADGVYLETYLSVVGASAVFSLNENNKLQSSIEITMLFKQEDKIVDFRKFNLLSPEVDTASINRPSFIDLQRIPLESGHYNLELTIKDNNSVVSPYKHNSDIDVNFIEGKIEISGIEPVEKYSITKDENILSKSGYDIIPYISDYYPESINELTFYTEIYNSDKILGESGSYLLKTYIEAFETEKSLHFNKFYKHKSSPVNILLGKFLITDLPSGNYNLVVEIRDRENELVTKKKMFFQRNNPSAHFLMDDILSINTDNTFIANMNNLDTLTDYLKCVNPISDFSERRYIDNLLQQSNTQLMKQFFYNFWYGRNSTDPGSAWNEYKNKVNEVNMSYTTQIRKGYETDRGRVYLQYGVPNTIRERKHEPACYPFEIWHYYSLNGNKDQKFLFYNPELVGDEYVLLHSNVPGEIINRNWESSLNSRMVAPGYITDDLGIDTNKGQDLGYGSIAKQLWENP